MQNRFKILFPPLLCILLADLPEDEKPKSGWDRALEELEEDSETE